MGCGQTLILGDGGYVTCSHLDCQQPDAVSVLLEDRETEHVVTFQAVGFTIQHPLRERLDGELEECEVHQLCLGLTGRPMRTGRYRVALDDNNWAFVPVEEP
jgi:hypothetical protein